MLNRDWMVTEEKLRPQMNVAVVGQNLVLLEEVGSTNDYLKQLAQEGAPDGTVVLAEQQSAGRGRLGRSFQSPAQKGIYLSVLLRPEIKAEKAINFTAVAAVAMCDALEQAVGLRPGIKWTNDLLMGGRKICGILTEMGADWQTGMVDYIVLGIGLNVNEQQDEFAPELRSIAGSVSMATGRQWDRNDIVAAMLNAIDRVYADWQAGRWSVDRYRADCTTIGKPVRVLRGDTVKHAVAEAVDDDFALVVRYEDGTVEHVFTGEVTVRGQEGYAH